MTLGQFVKEYRERNNLSQRQFALRCGLSNSYIHMLESQKNSKTGKPIVPNISSIKKISKAMGCTIDYILLNCDNLTYESEYYQESLTEDEKVIIEFFRRLDDKGKEIMLSLCRIERKQKNTRHASAVPGGGFSIWQVQFL